MRRWTSVVLCVVLSAAMVGPPVRGQTDPVQTLRQLFNTDPAQGFVQAERMFQAPMAKGDLEGMLEIIRVTFPAAVGRFYRGLEEAGSVEEALTKAQRSLMADEATRHPFYWAGFVAVRGPA